MVKGALQLESLESIGQAEIDSVVSAPVIQAVIEATTGTNTDGDGLRSPLSAFATRETSELMTPNGEFTGHAIEDEGPLRVSSISSVVIEDEYKKATEKGMLPLIGISFLLIAVLILLFMRAISDPLLTLAGLLMSMIWIVGRKVGSGRTRWA